MSLSISENLAANIRQLREKTGLSQQQIATLAEVPRPTWANLESGDANPTVSVLTKVAAALNVGVERLLAPARAAADVYCADSLPVQKRGRVEVRSLTPERLVGLGLERLTFPGGAEMKSTALPPNSQQVLACECGELAVSLGEKSYRLKAGDVLLLRSSELSHLKNVGRSRAIAYSVVSMRQLD